MANVDQDIRYAVTAEDRFSRTFQNLRRDISGTAGQFGQITSAAGAAGRVLGTLALGGAAGVGGLGLAVRQLANDLDALNDASDALGDSVENISALEDLARRNGSGLDLVFTGLNKINKVLSDANADSPLARALEGIGLSARELREVSPSEALRQVAVALQGYEDNGKRARLVQELFGKSTKEVAAFLKDLAEAGQLNATVTSQQAQEAERFNKQLFALSTNAGNAGRALLTNSGILRTLNEDLVRLNALGDVFGSAFGGAAALATEAKRFADAGAGAAFYAEKLRVLQTQRAIIAASPNPVARRGGLFDIDEEIAKVQKLEEFYRRVFSAVAPDLGQSDPRELARRGRGGGGLPSVPDLDTATKAKTTDADRYLATLDSQLQKLQDLTAVQQLELDLAKGIEGASTAAAQAQLRAAAQKLDLQRQVNKEIEREASLQKILSDKSQSDINDALSLLSATPTGRLQSIESDVDKLLALSRKLDANDPRQKQISEALTKLRADFDGIAEPAAVADAGFKGLEVTIDRFAENSIDAIAEFVATGKGDVGSLFDAFKRDVLKALITDPVRDTMKDVVQAIRTELSQVSGSNNPLASVFSFLQGLGGFFGNGGSGNNLDFSGQFDGQRAAGGRVRRGGRYLVGEKRPEVFEPDQDGYVYPNADVMPQGGGGGFQQVNHFTINGGSAEWRRELRAALDERDARLARSMRYGRLAGA